MHWILILVCASLGFAAAALATLTQTPIYQARTVSFVSTGDASSVGSAYTGSQFVQQRVKSYAEVVKSPQVLNRVVSDLRLDTTAEALAGKVSVEVPLDTVLLKIAVNDPDPTKARDISNAVATQLTRVVGELERGESERSSLVKVQTVTPAVTPVSPVSPRPTLNVALGLLVGLAIGVGGAVARETLDTSIKGTEDLQARLQLPTLASIPFDPNATKDPLLSQAPTGSMRAEAFRQLRTNLQFVDVDEETASIVVTSSLPGEGKSTTAANLAITLAQAGMDVILVEGDLRRPKVAEYLGIEGAVGLTDVLVGNLDLDDALQSWGTSGHLQVLASGPRPPNPSELLSSQHMATVIETMEKRAFVIFDAPPLLPVTDGAVLAAQASGALLVVRDGKTRREQVQRAVDALKAVDARLYGGVLTMASTKGPDAYQYGYGYYTSDARRPLFRRPKAAAS